MGLYESVRTKSGSFVHINLYFIVKRLFDIIISLTLLVLLSPLFLWISYRLYKKEGNPIFYREVRVGKNGRNFTLWSFRTMMNSSKVIRSLPPHPFPSSWEKGVPDYFKFIRDKNKVYTMTGTWLRKYNLEKLPQLVNVLKGDMSLVGPSPEIPEIAQYYNRYQSSRLKVRPGITGYAQIHDATNDNHGQKIKHDLYYINNYSYKLEGKIILEFFKRIFSNN
ncbi:sugar transferase [Ornithinibacillus caprae]|uniref:sugar transferase n=1 Tax=Ornithinibacillus caprae TaxID=2678566 RepID=UPI0012D8D942|nr:sugar transferase [Ornithinibacillus caprae]